MSLIFTLNIMTTIGHRILKFESMIKKLKITNHKFFAFATLSKNNSCACINSIVTQHLYYLIFKINFHQDNLPFLCLQLYKHNCPIFVFIHNEKINRNGCKRFVFFIIFLAHLSRKSQYKLYHRMFFWFLYICHHRLVKHLILFFKSPNSFTFF